MNRRELLKTLGLAASTSVLHWVPTAVADSYVIVTSRPRAPYRIVGMWAAGIGEPSDMGKAGRASLYLRGNRALTFGLNIYAGSAQWIPRAGEDPAVEDLRDLELRVDPGTRAHVLLVDEHGKQTVVTTYEDE